MREEFQAARVDLAAVLRWSSRLGYQQGVCNHFSFQLPGHKTLFLVNPEGFFWSELTASSLLVCDLDGTIVEGSGTVEQTAFCLHAPIHRHNIDARAVLHSHTPYTTALCLIEGAQIEPVNLTCILFSSNGCDPCLWFLLLTIWGNPFTAVTRVQIPSGTPSLFKSVTRISSGRSRYKFPCLMLTTEQLACKGSVMISPTI